MTDAGVTRAVLKNRERKPMDDKTIVDLLWQRDESVLAEVDLCYGRLYKGMLRRVLHDEQDVDECANDVRMALWNSVPPNRPQHLGAYLCTLARRIAIDRLRYNTRAKRNPAYTVLLSELEECLPDPRSFFVDDGGGLRQVLSDFVRELDPKTQIFFVRRYVYMETVPELAERFDCGENYISVRLYRARKKLRMRLKEEGILL